jgi:long-chain acyl-CoA synthetase
MTATVDTPTVPPAGATPVTLPAMLLAHAAARPKVVALRVKRLGRWLEISWREYAIRAASVAWGLRGLGIEPGDRVAILSENRPEWLFADVAIQGIGAVSVGVYPTSSEPEVAEVLRSSAAKIVIVEDEEQLDKTVAVRAELPQLSKIVVIDTRGIRSLGDPMTISLDQLENLGEAPSRDIVDVWRDTVVGVAGGDDPAIVVYTSGVGGPPQGAMLSHHNLIAAARVLGSFYDARDDEEILSYLPLCHVAERLVSLATAIQVGYVVNFGEGGESFVNDLREVQPTFFLGVPRVWEKLMGSVQFRIGNASRLKRWMYSFWQGRVARVAEGRRHGRPGGTLTRGLAWFFLLHSLRQKLGLSRIRIALSGAAPIAPGVLEYWWSLDVPLRETYGQTENTALATANPATDVRVGTVGVALPGVTIRLADDGEILVRSPGNFVGYLGDAAATRSVLDDEGWLHTGDLGVLDTDGYLSITGRTKDLIVTAGGFNVSPNRIENLIKVSPFIREAMVIGDRRPYLTALIGVESAAVADWARQQDLQFTNHQELVAQPEVRRLIDGTIADVNRQLSETEQIRAFEILPFDLDDIGALTATQKVRRQEVTEQCSDLIDRMYTAA